MSRRLAARASAVGVAALVLAVGPAFGATTATGQTGSGQIGSGQTVVGRATVIADTPGARLVIHTPFGGIAVSGVDGSADIATGDTVSVTVSDDSGGAIDWSKDRIDGVTAIGPVEVVEEAPGAAASVGNPDGDLTQPSKSPTAKARVARATVNHPVTLVRAYWEGTTAAEAGDWADIRQAFADSTAYWAEESDGAISFTAVGEHDAVLLPGTPCSLPDPGSNVATAIGWTYPPAANTHLAIFTPPCPETDWQGVAGFGTVGDNTSTGGWVVILGPDSLAGTGGGDRSAVLAHEFGHNLSLGHSQELACASGSAQVSDASPAACNAWSYEGMYSVMGASWLGYSPPALTYAHRARLGIVRSGSTVEVPRTSAVQNYALSALAGTSGLRTILLTHPTTGDRYAIEYRSNVGLDAGIIDNPFIFRPLPKGVVITKIFARERQPFKNDDSAAAEWYRTWTLANESYLLDMNPAVNTASNFLNSPNFDGNPVLPVGSIVRLGPWDIRVNSAGTTAAVTITGTGFIPPLKQAAPTVSVPLTPATSLGQVKVVWKGSGSNNYRLVWTNSPTGARVMSTASAGSVTFSRVGFTRSMALRLDACNLAGSCIAGTPAATTVTGPVPMIATASAGVVGNASFSLGLSGSITGQTWRVYVCNTRTAGSACNPVSAPGRIYTALRSGNQKVDLNLGKRTCLIGKTTCAGSWGSTVFRNGDRIRYTVVTYRTPRSTAGFRTSTGGYADAGALTP